MRFFYRLMKYLPTAEAAAGEWNEAETDILRLSAHADDVTDAGRGEVAEMLRPFYLEYLRKHHVSRTLRTASPAGRASSARRAGATHASSTAAQSPGRRSATRQTNATIAACPSRRATTRPWRRTGCGSRRSAASSSRAPSSPRP